MAAAPPPPTLLLPLLPQPWLAWPLLALATFVAANALAWRMEECRRRRIAQKVRRLAAQSDAGGGDEARRGRRERIPVSIISGFAGSGKTTLVNHGTCAPPPRARCRCHRVIALLSDDQHKSPSS